MSIKGRISSGSIDDGKARGSDFLGSPSNLTLSKPTSDVDDNDVYDASLSIGRVFPVTDAESTFVTPYIGIAYQEQDYRISNDVQSLGMPMPAVSLNSRYKAEWSSTFIGVQFDHSGDRWDTYASVEYHDVDYEARGDWNLRGDFEHPRSFKHDAEGSGPV